jgi:hypothetical protein
VHAAFVKKIEAEGIKLDEPPRKNAVTASAFTYITDSGARSIELVQRAPVTQEACGFPTGRGVHQPCATPRESGE